MLRAPGRCEEQPIGDVFRGVARRSAALFPVRPSAFEVMPFGGWRARPRAGGRASVRVTLGKSRGR